VVGFREALGVWARIGVLGFGGPAGEIALMHRMLVEERHWIGEARFLHALNYCMLLPGPGAQQLATCIGWLLHGTRGGVAAGMLLVLPGFAVVLALSALYAALRGLPAVDALFFALKPAVLAVVVEALLRIARRALRGPVLVGIAALAFIAIFLLEVHFPLIVIGAGLVGLVGRRTAPAAFARAPVRRSRPASCGFLGAPYVEALRGRRALDASLSAITAAVVGIILNLAVWFALHVLFGAVGEWRLGPGVPALPAALAQDPRATQSVASQQSCRRCGQSPRTAARDRAQSRTGRPPAASPRGRIELEAQSAGIVAVLALSAVRVVVLRVEDEGSGEPIREAAVAEVDALEGALSEPEEAAVE
jgi:chromate transport protein ChrA